MSDNLITVGTYGNAAEAEIAHAALMEEDIPAFVEQELAAIALPGTPVKLQVPEDRVRKAELVLEKIERRKMHRLPASSNLAADGKARFALLLSCIALILLPVLVLLRAFAVVLFGSEWADLLKVQVTAPMLALPILFALASTFLLAPLIWKRPEMTEEGRKYLRDAWWYDCVVLGAGLAGLLPLLIVGTY